MTMWRSVLAFIVLLSCCSRPEKEEASLYEFLSRAGEAVNAGNAMLLTWRDHPGGPRVVVATPNVRYLPNVNPPQVRVPAGGHSHTASAPAGGWQHLATAQ